MRQRTVIRTVSWAALTIAMACAAFTATAGPGPLTRISADAILGIVGMVLFALIAGYTKRMDRDLGEHKDATTQLFNALSTEQRQQQAQINLLRADFHRDHPSRPEFTDLREDMRDRFDRLENLIRSGAGNRGAQ